MDNPVLYHYTNLNALPSILRRDHVLLWATNIYFLNDPSELNYGIRLFNEVNNCKSSIQGLEDIYITCFSENPDSLVMWSSYGNNASGCAIALDYEKVKVAFQDLNKVIYDSDEAKKVLTPTPIKVKITEEDKNISIFPEELNKYFIREMKAFTNCWLIKHPAYSHEEEIRGVVFVKRTPPINGDPEDEQFGFKPENVQFRLRNNIIVPYLEVKIPVDAVQQIVLGPTANENETRKSIELMLNLKGYDVPVVKSQIPYRG